MTERMLESDSRELPNQRTSFREWSYHLWDHLLSIRWPVLSELSSKFTKSETVLLFNCWVVSDSSWPHGLQHSRPPCPSLSSGVCSNWCPFSWWCHPTVSSSVAPFSSCPQSFPALGSFPMSQLFSSGDQSIGASASVLPVNIQGWFPLELAILIYLLSKRLSRVFSSTTIQKHQKEVIEMTFPGGPGDLLLDGLDAVPVWCWRDSRHPSALFQSWIIFP